MAQTQTKRAINEDWRCRVIGTVRSAGNGSAMRAGLPEQRRIPLIVNVGTTPLTKQGYEFLVRNFPTGMCHNGLKTEVEALIEATEGHAPTTVFCPWNLDNFGMAQRRAVDTFPERRDPFASCQIRYRV